MGGWGCGLGTSSTLSLRQPVRGKSSEETRRMKKKRHPNDAERL